MRPVLTLAALVLLACGGDTTTTASDSAADDTGGVPSDADLANGQAVHDTTCANDYCHGGDTRLDDEVPGMSDAALETQILEGSGYMPAQDHLTDDEVRDVIAYLRKTYG